MPIILQNQQLPATRDRKLNRNIARLTVPAFLSCHYASMKLDHAAWVGLKAVPICIQFTDKFVICFESVTVLFFNICLAYDCGVWIPIVETSNMEHNSIWNLWLFISAWNPISHPNRVVIPPLHWTDFRLDTLLCSTKMIPVQFVTCLSIIEESKHRGHHWVHFYICL